MSHSLPLLCSPTHHPPTLIMSSEKGVGVSGKEGSSLAGFWEEEGPQWCSAEFCSPEASSVPFHKSCSTPFPTPTPPNTQFVEISLQRNWKCSQQKSNYSFYFLLLPRNLWWVQGWAKRNIRQSFEKYITESWNNFLVWNSSTTSFLCDFSLVTSLLWFSMFASTKWSYYLTSDCFTRLLENML